MKYARLLILAMALGLGSVAYQGCSTAPVTLEAGGAYSDAYLATTDQAILDAARTLDGFMAWYKANATFLAKYPEVGVLAASVSAHQNEWLRNAYTARDTYASAEAAYKKSLSSAPPSTAGVVAALSVITDVTKQIAAYRASHP